MLIGFDGEACEAFQKAVDRLHGYGVTLTLEGGGEVDAILVGADRSADDGAAVRFVRAEDGNYELGQYSEDRVESAVVERIQVS